MPSREKSHRSRIKGKINAAPEVRVPLENELGSLLTEALQAASLFGASIGFDAASGELQLCFPSGYDGPGILTGMEHIDPPHFHSDDKHVLEIHDISDLDDLKGKLPDFSGDWRDWLKFWIDELRRFLDKLKEWIKHLPSENDLGDEG